MSAPVLIVLFGVAWLLIVVLAVALCRAAALGDEQATRREQAR